MIRQLRNYARDDVVALDDVAGAVLAQRETKEEERQ